MTDERGAAPRAMSADGPEDPEASASPAIDKPEAKALSWSQFVSTYLPALILALGTGVALPSIPALAKSFHVSFGLASFVTTSFLIGSVVGTLPSGWMIDRLGRRRIMLLGPLLTALMAFATATAHTFPEILIYRFFDGCASQMWLIGRLAAISHGASANQRGRQVSWMFGMDNTGRFLGPTVGGFIAVGFGIRAPFVAYGILALLALLPAFMFTKDTPRVARATSANAEQSRLTTRQIVQPRLIYFAVAFFAALARGPAGAQLLYLYAAFAYHLKPVEIGYLATAAGSIALPMGFLAGSLMDRYGRKRTMVPGFTGVTVTMVGLALVAYMHLSLHWYVVVLLLGMLCQSLTGGSVQTIGADVAPPEARGRFLGLWRFTGQGGVALSPLVFAGLAAEVDYGSAFLFIAASAAVVSLLLVRFVPETGVATARRRVIEPEKVEI
jgi:MFS family permease